MDQLRIGVDVGGTKIAAGLVDATGAVHARTNLPTPTDRGGQGVLEGIEQAARAVGEGREFTAIGVGTGGVVDAATGTIRSATDLLPGWAGTEVGPWLRARFGVPVAVDNDVNALAAGELRFGTGIAGTVLYAAIGTGIGGALVVDGKLRHGSHHTAGGIGHQPVGGHRRCSCGRAGHLEAAASGPAIAAAYREASGDAGITDLREVARRAAAGEELARTVIGTAAATLGRALGGAANLLDPDQVVLGGGVTRMEGPFLDQVREAFVAELLAPLRRIELLAARLGADASVIGAAALVLGDSE
ncbi:ROK family protein [Sciscionella sediminilitoris]|uniref:ROK family protein n=1 Tax=Sciscionella sediminilitoris TaxID=1445613 RepID=UPI0004DEE3B5|nr:ROK family protein [Sciscionella sp. SE31]